MSLHTPEFYQAAREYWNRPDVAARQRRHFDELVALDNSDLKPLLKYMQHVSLIMAEYQIAHPEMEEHMRQYGDAIYQEYVESNEAMAAQFGQFFG